MRKVQKCILICLIIVLLNPKNRKTKTNKINIEKKCLSQVHNSCHG